MLEGIAVIAITFAIASFFCFDTIWNSYSGFS